MLCTLPQSWCCFVHIAEHCYDKTMLHERVPTSYILLEVLVQYVVVSLARFKSKSSMQFFQRYWCHSHSRHSATSTTISRPQTKTGGVYASSVTIKWMVVLRVLYVQSSMRDDKRPREVEYLVTLSISIVYLSNKMNGCGQQPFKFSHHLFCSAHQNEDILPMTWCL